MRTSLQHWLNLWGLISARSEGLIWYERLCNAYGEAPRHYHNLQHLTECLMALDQAKRSQSIPSAEAIEVALWFHDAVYDPQAGDNEERSAQLAEEVLSEALVAPSLIECVSHLIMTTKTHDAFGETEQAWISDIDLSIFGQSPERFAQYESQIRQEYQWVSDAIYIPKRIEILMGFLKRPRLYLTSYFHQRLDTQARHNLNALIERLQN